MNSLCFFGQARRPEILELKGSVCTAGALGMPDLTAGLCVQNCHRPRASTDVHVTRGVCTHRPDGRDPAIVPGCPAVLSVWDLSVGRAQL